MHRNETYEGLRKPLTLEEFIDLDDNMCDQSPFSVFQRQITKRQQIFEDEIINRVRILQEKIRDSKTQHGCQSQAILQL